MGHGILRQSFNRQHQLTSNEHEQYYTTNEQHGQSTISYAVRLALQNRPANTISFSAPIPGSPRRLQRQRLATKCSQCI